MNRLNEYFVTIGSELLAAIPPASTDFKDYLKKSYSDSFALYLTDSFEVVNVVSNFADKAIFGADEIPLKILKSLYFLHI